jgi:predicted nucleic acid-binding protein
MAPPRQVVLADASALVAVLDERDRNHHRCAELLRTIRDSDLLTTCAAFTEAMYLLGSRRGWPGRRALWEVIERGILRVAPEQRDEWSRVAQLMGKYRDTPMALADAQLMALAEDLGGPPIFTLDSDFTIYRLPNGTAPTLLP